MAKVITLTAYRRVNYTAQVLEGLRHCVGVSEYLLLPTVDYHPDASAWNLLSQVDFMPCQPRRQSVRQGCNRNTFVALQRGFEEAQAEFVVHLEDDIVPGPDFLQLMEHGDRTYRGVPRILSIGAYSRAMCNEPYGDEKAHKLVRREGFCCWGFGTWRDRWDMHLRDKWVFKPKPLAWDSHIEQNIRQPANLLEVCPMVSRTQNIGAAEGAFCPGPDWHRQHVHLELWSGNKSLPAGDFHE